MIEQTTEQTTEQTNTGPDVHFDQPERVPSPIEVLSQMLASVSNQAGEERALYGVAVEQRERRIAHLDDEIKELKKKIVDLKNEIDDLKSEAGH